MIEQKLLAIQKSIESYSVHLDMLMKLDKPIADFRVSSRIQSTDLFYKENGNTITINRALEKLKESYVELENPSEIEIISPSITRIKEFPNPIPGTSVVRWNDIDRSFEYISQTSLGLSAGTSIFELEHFVAATSQGILVFTTNSVYATDTRSMLNPQRLFQTNGTITLNTCSNYALIYVDGSEIFFEGSDLTNKQYRIVNTSQTTVIRFAGDLDQVEHTPENTGSVCFDLVASGQVDEGYGWDHYYYLARF